VDDETKMVLARIAETVREEQRFRGLSTRELAARATMDVAELDQILGAEVEVPLARIILLAGALGVRSERLLAGVEWIPDRAGGGGRFRITRPGG
jgi:transcriptional regulator with XRE-family HTH domain